MPAQNLLKHLLHDESGATAVEYGLIVALIVIAMIVALQGLATETVTMWNGVDSKVVAARAGA